MQNIPHTRPERWNIPHTTVSHAEHGHRSE